MLMHDNLVNVKCGICGPLVRKYFCTIVLSEIVFGEVVVLNKIPSVLYLVNFGSKLLFVMPIRHPLYARCFVSLESQLWTVRLVVANVFVSRNYVHCEDIVYEMGFLQPDVLLS